MFFLFYNISIVFILFSFKFICKFFYHFTVVLVKVLLYFKLVFKFFFQFFNYIFVLIDSFARNCQFHFDSVYAEWYY